MPRSSRIAAFAGLAVLGAVNALSDLPIFTDGALASGWEDWSWGSTINYAATDLFEGESSISVNSTQYSAFSVKLEGTFPGYAGLRFDIAVCFLQKSVKNLSLNLFELRELNPT